MRVSVVQMTPGHVKAENIAQARGLIDGATAEDRPDIISLPEVWTCLGGDSATKLAEAEALPPPGSNEPGGAAYEFLRSVAREKRIHVHGGSIIERAGERLFNTTVVFDPQGGEIARYRKIHLFDITAPDGTGYRESAAFGAGDAVVTYEANGTKVGCAICYDLRFPELFLALRRAGAELIFLPAAFTLADRQGPLGGAAAGARDRDAVLVCRPRGLGPPPGGRTRAALHLWAFAGVRPVGARGGEGLGRDRLGDGAHRSRDHRAGAPRHAGAGASQARLTRGGFRPVADRDLRRPHPARDGSASPPDRTLRRRTARYGKGGGGAGRRRLHAGDAAPRARPQPAGLWHELRFGRVPDERLRRGGPARAHRTGARRRCSTRCGCAPSPSPGRRRRHWR